ncbi:hypothetical protein AAFF_G00106300 [Aldrovandia affinis]|uniref:Uncharacterized protein n=1 Tax=Aldrovandia affinis TaxID=143900 RepID=A0AAD7T2B2_9TELE|nr:hypothetical protein AAFF_G00106300 [Aldrovandia affinis]
MYGGVQSLTDYNEDKQTPPRLTDTTHSRCAAASPPRPTPAVLRVNPAPTPLTFTSSPLSPPNGDLAHVISRALSGESAGAALSLVPNGGVRRAVSAWRSSAV